MPARRSARPTVADRKAAAITTALSPGDHYETSVTMGIKHRGNDYWIKEGVTIQVRDGEDGEAARERAKNFVYDTLHLQIERILEDD